MITQFLHEVLRWWGDEVMIWCSELIKKKSPEDRPASNVLCHTIEDTYDIISLFYGSIWKRHNQYTLFIIRYIIYYYLLIITLPFICLNQSVLCTRIIPLKIYTNHVYYNIALMCVNKKIIGLNYVMGATHKSNRLLLGGSQIYLIWEIRI